jgi:hypothetical protein
MSVSSYLIVKPDLQYKAAPNTDIGIQTELLQTQSEVVDYDRTVSLNLITVFDGERQKSTTFRPTIKISYLYENNLVGYTDYDVYKNSLVYINPEISVINGSWSGLPTYQEFEFIRTDIDNKQIPFVTKSASSYNWNIVMSYPYENDYNVPMQYFFENGTSINPWKSGDGIPFYIVLGSERGLPVVQFNCPVEHGLLEGEYVELPFTYNDVNTFQVYSLGNGTLGSDANTFNLANVGFTGTTFNTGVTGVFKRIIDVNNSGETKSRYYVRIHKIITDPHDSIITMNGFELNSFNDEGVYQFSSLTPNKIGRVSAYQSSKTYNVTLAHDLSIINQQDNNKKPLTQIFATFQFVGYMGWFNQLRRGWKFNMLPGKTNQWWSTTNNDSLETNDITGYTRTHLPRTSGDTMYGDWCEWNEITQTERVISPYMQKLTYYQKGFTVPTTATTNPNGYYYQVHNPITLKVFSSYLETASNNLVEDVPVWAYFSNNLQQWIWREIYTYGYIDSLERGVDYPFLNETHYPFDNLQFRLYPEGASFDITQLYPDVVVDPIIDGCE